MGQLSSLHFKSPSNELCLVQCKEYTTKYSGLVVLKLQAGGDLLLAGNEVGTLLVYDISLDSDSPRQVIVLSFEYGGVSDICWLDTNNVAVGTTRGRIIVFSIKNELKRLVEISTVKAHGDGAAQIAVEGLDYWPKSHCLVSVAEGVGSVRLWDISEEGVITARALPKPTTAYCTPRYVGFCQGGSQLIVAFMEQSLIQVFSTDPLEIKSEFRLGHEEGLSHHGHLGNALVLDSMDRLVIYNLHEGCAFYDLPGKVRAMDVPYAGNHDDGNPYCNQGIALLANAGYVATVSKHHGVIHILRTRDGSRAGSLKTSGRRHQDIQAIHATSGNRTVLVAASTDNVNGPSRLTVWQNKLQEDRHLRNAPSPDRNERSTVGIALLCLGFCMAFQVMVSLLPVSDFRTLFGNRSSTFMDQPRHNGGPQSSSQPSITLVTTVVTTTPSKSYAPVSVLPSRNSQLPSPPPLQQSVRASPLGGNLRIPLSSARLCINKNVLYDSGSCASR